MLGFGMSDLLVILLCVILYYGARHMPDLGKDLSQDQSREYRSPPSDADSV